MHELRMWNTTSSKDTGLRNLPFDADSHDNHRDMVLTTIEDTAIRAVG
jgi:hypothetical protein